MFFLMAVKYKVMRNKGNKIHRISTVKKEMKAWESVPQLRCYKHCKKLQVRVQFHSCLKPENQAHNLERIRDQ